MHAYIIGLATVRRVQAVSGDHKIEAFMAAAGLADWVLCLDGVDALPARL